MRLRLAELIAALSLATDLGLGLPQEHVLRQCRIALGLARARGRGRGGAGGRVLRGDAGVGRLHRRLLRALGAVRRRDRLPRRRQPHRPRGAAADGADAAAGGGRARAAAAGAAGGDAGGDRRARRHRGDDRALPGRGGDRGAPGPRPRGAAAAAARLLALGRQGHAQGRGEALPWRSAWSTSRRSPRCTIASAGVEGAIAVTRERSGGQFDPRLATAFADCAHDLLDGLEEESSWDAVIAAEPALDKPLAEDEIDAALEAVADFSDLKSPWFGGHSRGVARLAAGAARACGARLRTPSRSCGGRGSCTTSGAPACRTRSGTSPAR